jgi:osmotically-inducible protein OsmY
VPWQWCPSQLKLRESKRGWEKKSGGSELRQSWQDVRQQVAQFGLRGRVYARLHWDKRLQGANLDVDARDSQTVVLRGTVRDAAAKQKAVELARETEGIDNVIDELVVAPARP